MNYNNNTSNVMAHEIGHVLGMDHTVGDGKLMDEDAHEFVTADIENIKSAIGRAGIGQPKPNSLDIAIGALGKTRIQRLNGPIFQQQEQVEESNKQLENGKIEHVEK